MADASSSVRVNTIKTLKIPDDLYELCLTNLVNYIQKSKCDRNDLRSLPDSILMDVYYKVSANVSYLCCGVDSKNTPLCCRMTRFRHDFLAWNSSMYVIGVFSSFWVHGRVTAGVEIPLFKNHFHWYTDSRHTL